MALNFICVERCLLLFISALWQHLSQLRTFAKYGLLFAIEFKNIHRRQVRRSCSGKPTAVQNALTCCFSEKAYRRFEKIETLNQRVFYELASRRFDGF